MCSLFGGASRFIYHGIYEMFPDTSPSFLPLTAGRINITCRYTPHLLGREMEFATVPADELKKRDPSNNPFYNLKN